MPPTDPAERVQAAFHAAVPAEWRVAVPVEWSLREGSSSLSWSNGRTAMALRHAGGDWDRLVHIVAHEFGHHIAYRFGTTPSLGTPPVGWPGAGAVPEENWADCVARALTGHPLESHGLPPCTGAALDWTVAYLAAGPPG